MGNGHSGNKTVDMFADPVGLVEKIFGTAHNDIASTVSTLHDDVADTVAYGGKHLVNDVDNLSNSMANFLPYIIGGAVILYVMK